MKKDKLILKTALTEFKQGLFESFSTSMNMTSLTNQLVNFIDEIIRKLYFLNQLDKDEGICLLALGSYGRRELQIYSDIDILVLHKENLAVKTSGRLHVFIQDLWDIGLDVGHQITTVNACAELANQDITVISSLLDMRLLCGRMTLAEELSYQTHPNQMWPSDQFFLAKQQEQFKRYKKYGESAYILEPNIKNGPGGLRDLHILLCISKRHFSIKKLADSIAYGFLTAKEYEELILCQHFLWRVRFGLHIVAKRQEERLLFDYQIKIANLLGYKDDEKSLAIEKFMKSYFQVIKRLREINEMLLQLFQEAIIEEQKQQIQPISDDFQLSNDYIEVTNNKVFIKKPIAMMELFYWIAKLPQIKGVRAHTIRLLHESTYLIDETFRDNNQAKKLFITILKQSTNIFVQLKLMNRYGVLGRYIPSFAHVIGQMQYDLFHVYTVDQHTLYVIRNIVRFKQKSYIDKFPLCASIIHSIEKPEILILSALFHDIAKGRGGDHSILGAEDSFVFAKAHNLEDNNCQLLSWLVKNHLLMSQTAQRQDIYSPQTIEKFCTKLPKPFYLDYLYLLTVADICATNKSLWNSWKDSLLRELYRASTNYFTQKQKRLDEKSVIMHKKQNALQQLLDEGEDKAKIESLWTNFKGKYFLHESPTIIARHTKSILNTSQYPLILILPHHSQGGTELFIYMPHKPDRFTITTTVLSNHYVNILEAQILTCKNDFDLDTYIILDNKNRAIFDDKKINAIKDSLYFYFTKDSLLPNITQRRITRHQAHFNITPKITFSDEQNRTLLFLVTADRPRLLGSISRTFAACDILLHHAKISTAGERVEDMFFITNSDNDSLTEEQKSSLKTRLINTLTQLGIE
jgi:[protein-PII] uridylyltransferase